MKNALASFIAATLTLSSFALASEPKQKVDLNKLKLLEVQLSTSELNPDIQKILESKALEQKFLNGIEKLRLGTNSGGGGDEVGLDFQRTLHAALEGLRNQDPNTFKTLQEKDIMGTASQAKIIVVDEELEAPIKGYTQNSVAVNLPHVKTILVNRQRWNNVKDSIIKEGIALHEIVSLLKLESTGRYDISSRYVAAKGGKKEMLLSSSQVNRLQQIQSLDKTLSPTEVLKRLFEEASDPISIYDFDLNTDQKSNQKCQEIGRHGVKGLREIYVRRLIVTTKDAAPDRGPLFPAKPAVVEWRFGYVGHDDMLPAPEDLKLWGNSSMSTTATELQMNHYVGGGRGVSKLARRNGNLLTIKLFERYMTEEGKVEGNPESNTESKPVYIYCYRQ